MAEVGGTYGLGRSQPSVDGREVEWSRSSGQIDDLRGAFDAKLSVQRLLGAWFGLGLQVGWSNWQSEYLYQLHHPRSDYLSLALQPELRLHIGDCRRCPLLIVGARVGGALDMSGQYGRKGWGVAKTKLGGGAVWGMHFGVEVPVAPRVSVRVSGAYEAALLRHRVSYGWMGSELVSFRIDRPLGLVGVAVGL